MSTETQHPTAQASPILPRTRERRQRSRVRVPALTILYHPDLSRVGECSRLTDLMSGREALVSRSAPVFETPVQGRPQPLGDPYLSRSPWRLHRDPETGSVRLLCVESRISIAADGVAIPEQRDFTAGEVQRGVVLELAEGIVLLLPEVPASPDPAPGYADLIGENEGI